jgi:outer membrane lipoprotein-sorting protein
MKSQGFFLAFMVLANIVFAQDTGDILRKIDANMSSVNRVFESEMTIHGRRNSRTIVSRSHSEGSSKSFTEYLSPASERGTKMLKIDNQLWIYNPSTDRTIQLSGHMLRQSVMGSDLSYEDMMDDRKLVDVYQATLIGEETMHGRKVWVLQLDAKVSDLAYQSQKMWVDTERYVPLLQEMYAKGGKLLRKIEVKEVKQIQGRWFPMRVLYKDMLKQGEGTEFKITDIRFDQKIPDHIFSKASLR